MEKNIPVEFGLLLVDEFTLGEFLKLIWINLKNSAFSPQFLTETKVWLIFQHCSTQMFYEK